MFDFVFGLPMHALVIHAVVVLVPLSALCTIAYVSRPSWRRVLFWPTAAGALISGVSAFVAAESGEKLLVRVSTTRASTTNFELLANHTMWGDRAKVVCLVFMVLALGAAVLMSPPPADPAQAGAGSATASRESFLLRAARWRAVALPPAVQAPTVQLILGVVVAIVSLAALVVVALAGHAGAQVVWDGLG